MRRSQAAGKWDQFDVEVLYRQSMAIVGYGGDRARSGAKSESDGHEGLRHAQAARIVERRSPGG